MKMNRKRRAILMSSLFLVSIPLLVVGAWKGDHFAVISLGLIAAFLAVLSGYLQYHWGETLDGWRESLDKWGATTKYSVEQSRIMHDALNDLADHDTEAVHIHSGRAMAATVEYEKTFREEK